MSLTFSASQVYLISFFQFDYFTAPSQSLRPKHWLFNALLLIFYCNRRLSIVESIPENLTYPYRSPSYSSTYDSWMALLKSATETVDIASYYWTLRGHGNISDITDKQVRSFIMLHRHVH